ncbi:phospholipid/cholesterol/gamma-HCH transport system permease protein [Thermomonospora echinospora]|uniref:Phospholipid/cholesterol/gamma-HCH transport system permease protein n=1 Tax=Thermomonospora echinospora TaxID=1992 RepID=A0A1H6D8K7_9ACTN|nr:ABC transporter permease [Thermomonospora echinospora]SEG81458.1 phospholipid/cholesterol/gamma-HCH transport system permease protein [Thermomonospora echinospora]
MDISVPHAASARLARISSAAAARTADLAEWPVFLCRVLFHSVRDIVLRLRYAKVVALQVSDIVIGVGATVVGGGMIFVIFIMSLFLGTEVGLQAYTGLEVIGAESFMGLIGAFINVRETTPIIAAIALAAQCGSSFTAELGAMRISEEIDALEVMGINSFVYLVCTRVVAALIALVPLYLIALFASFFATRFISTSFFNLAPGVYDYYFYLYLPPRDLFYSAVKVGVFAFAVITVHCYYGYYATGGPAGVGQAAGRAIRLSIVTIVTLNLLLSYLFWGQGGTVRLAG